MKVAPAKSAPILITGSHRSGTTLIGSTLAECGVHYVYEPFHPHSPPGVSFPVFRSIYHYLDGGAWPQYEAALVGLCGGYWSPFARPKTPLMDRLSIAKKSAGIKMAHALGRPLLIKGSELILSIGTFVEKCSGRVVVTVRHPCAFVLSCQRMNWRFNLEELTSQAEFYERFIQPVPGFGRCTDDTIDPLVVENTWLWYALHSYLLAFLRDSPAAARRIMVTFHENLCLDPDAEFDRLCSFLELPKTRSMIEKRNKRMRGSTVHVAGENQHHLERNSRDLAYAWKDKISAPVNQWICSVAEPLFESLRSYSNAK